MTKYLFFDYDGTLAEKDKHPTPGVIAALGRAKAAGHKIFVCSGRCRYMLPAIFGVEFDGYVLACGTDVRVGGETLTDRLVTHESLKECAELSVAQGKTFIAEGENIAVRIGTGAEDWGCPQVSDFAEFKARYENTALINKFSIMSPCGDDIIDAAAQNGYRFIDHVATGEFVPVGFSKEAGITRVLEYFGANRADTVAFGDSMNDLDMIQFAGTGVAMGNSVEALKANADFVAPSVTEDGVAYYIDEILLKEGR